MSNRLPGYSSFAYAQEEVSYERVVLLAAKSGIILPLVKSTPEAIASQRAAVNEARIRTPEELAHTRAYAALTAEANAAAAKVSYNIAEGRYRASNVPHEQEILAHARDIAQNAEAIARRLETEVERGALAAALAIEAPIPRDGGAFQATAEAFCLLQ
ncbi:MAG: hypothetical protein HZB76_01735 [Chlamydiae bacterium]|nr:hypothetical protein [Chlamydiota bacterium]